MADSNYDDDIIWRRQSAVGLEEAGKVIILPSSVQGAVIYIRNR